MPKPHLEARSSILESQIIETLLAGLRQWRPDLKYPESHSDMQACVRGLLQMYSIERLPLPVPLKLECTACDGIGKKIDPKSNEAVRYASTCETCHGKGWIAG